MTNYSTIKKGLAQAENQARTIQTSLSNFKDQSLTNPNPQVNNLQTKLSDAISNMNLQPQTDTIMQRYQQAQDLAKQKSDAQSAITNTNYNSEIGDVKQNRKEQRTGYSESLRGIGPEIGRAHV